MMFKSEHQNGKGKVSSSQTGDLLRFSESTEGFTENKREKNLQEVAVVRLTLSKVNRMSMSGFTIQTGQTEWRAKPATAAQVATGSNHSSNSESATLFSRRESHGVPLESGTK